MVAHSEKKLTIHDIAKKAGVSHTTVSRVLNDDSRVLPKTKDRVLSVVRAYNFVPNPRARAFSSNKSHLIGLLISDISNPFFAELAKGMEDKAYELGYHVIICSTKKMHKGLGYLNFLMKAGVDGLVFASATIREPKIRKLIKDDFPIVMVNQKLAGEDFNYVICDNKKGAQSIVNHLLDLGHTKIGIITGPENIFTGHERLVGYRNTLEQRGLVINEDYIIQKPFGWDSGYHGTRQLLDLQDRPQAIFAGNDNIARGVLDALSEAQLKIPDDIAVAGFDDTTFASHSSIKLTTINQKKYEMGCQTAKLLIEMIEQKTRGYNQHIILEPELIVRESCGYKIMGKQTKSKK